MKHVKHSWWLVLICLVLFSLTIPPAYASIVPEPDDLESLSNSNVTFDINGGGDTCFVRGSSQTFCFSAVSASTGWEDAYEVFLRFLPGWSISNVYVSGTPFCLYGGAVGPLQYVYIHEIYVQIRQTRWHYQTGDICQAYYCIEATSSKVLPPLPNAWVSWYWEGTSQGNPPYHPCSSDGYTPVGEEPCDQSIYDPAIIPGCKLDFIPISIRGF